MAQGDCDHSPVAECGFEALRLELPPPRAALVAPGPIRNPKLMGLRMFQVHLVFNYVRKES